MKVLSIKEPFATLIKDKVKIYETRSWKTNYRGEIYVHASMSLSKSENVETAKIFEKSEVKVWECRNCGHIVVGTKAPEVCPVCAHPQAYFQVTDVSFE